MTNIKKISTRVISLTVIAIVLSLFSVSLVLASRDAKVYPSNLYTGGISLENLNRDQAINRLEKDNSFKWGTALLQLKLPDKTVSIPIKECGITPDYDLTLDNVDAFMKDLRDGGLLKHVIIRGQDQNLNLVYSCNKDLLYNQIKKVQADYSKPAIDARILYNDGLLEYISHQNGYIIDTDPTMENVYNELRKGNLGPIEAGTTIVYPRVKIDDIKTVKDIIGVYAIAISPEQSEKGSSLRKATEEFNGTIIMPGETFSIGDKISKIKSIANQPARIFYPLKQAVSKAAQQANLALKPRTDGNNITIHNNLNSPVLLSAVIQENKISVRIFGCRTDEEKAIHLTTEEIEIPSQVRIITDTNLKPGQRRIEQEGKKGLAIRTYRIVTKDGRQLEKTLLTEDLHRGRDTIIAIGPDSPGK